MPRITNKKTRSFRSGKQTCKVCGCTDKFDFKVPNRLWKKVVPVEYQNKVVCLECFTSWPLKRVTPLTCALVAHFPGTRRQPLLDKICCWPIRTVRTKVPGVAVARPSVHRCHRAFLNRKSDYLYYFGVKKIGALKL